MVVLALIGVGSYLLGWSISKRYTLSTQEKTFEDYFEEACRDDELLFHERKNWCRWKSFFPGLRSKHPAFAEGYAAGCKHEQGLHRQALKRRELAKRHQEAIKREPWTKAPYLEKK